MKRDTEIGYLDVGGNIFPISIIKMALDNWNRPIFVLSSKPTKVTNSFIGTAKVLDVDMNLLWRTVNAEFDLSNISPKFLVELTLSIVLTTIGSPEQIALEALAEISR